MNKPFRMASLFAGDTLKNLVTGLGYATRDRNVSTQYSFVPLTLDQIEAAYRSDWVARKAVNIPAFDMTREWRAWQAEDDQIEQLEETEKLFDVQRKVKRALIRARLYGGGAIVMGMGGANENATMPLDLDRVSQGDLRWLQVFSSNEISRTELETEPDSPYYGEPKTYRMSSRSGRFLADVHPSRVVRFVGAEVPDISRSIDGWGDSILQSIDTEVKNIGLTTQGIAELVHEAKLDVIKVPNLAGYLSTQESKDNLIERFQMMGMIKSLINVTLVDSEEEWNRIAVSFASLPEVLQQYLLIASGAADIPATRMLGQSPAGLNSTGESDLRNYYDRIRAEQNTELCPSMYMLDEVLIRTTLGTRPPEIHYEWRPLWQISDKEKGEIAQAKANAHKIDVELGLLDEEALRKGRENQLVEDGTYPGFEAALAEVEELDEDDEQVKAQMAIEPQKQALAGQQITSLMEIVAAVGSKDMPVETAKAIMTVAFPTLSEDEISAMIDPMEDFEPPPKPAPTFGIQPSPDEPPKPGEPPLQLRGRPSQQPSLMNENID